MFLKNLKNVPSWRGYWKFERVVNLKSIGSILLFGLSIRILSLFGRNKKTSTCTHICMCNSRPWFKYLPKILLGWSEFSNLLSMENETHTCVHTHNYVSEYWSYWSLENSNQKKKNLEKSILNILCKTVKFQISIIRILNVHMDSSYLNFAKNTSLLKKMGADHTLINLVWRRFQFDLWRLKWIKSFPTISNCFIVPHFYLVHA